MVKWLGTRGFGGLAQWQFLVKFCADRRLWLLRSVLIVLWCWLLWQLAKLIWLLLSPVSLPFVTIQSSETTLTPYQPLVHLFPEKIATNHAVGLADMQTLQGWQLLGVVIDPPTRIALVRLGTSAQFVWLHEQQTTPQGVQVVRIEPTQVTFMTRQGRYVLSLFSQNEPRAVQSSVSHHQGSVDLSILRAQVQRDPMVVMHWLTLVPQFEQGHLRSVLVQAKTGQEAIFKQLGFVTGDRLLALNGRSVDVWMHQLNQLPNVLEAAGAQVKVLRSGKELEWSLTW